MAFEYPAWMKNDKQKAAYKKFIDDQKAYEAFVIQLCSLKDKRNIGNADVGYGLSAKMTEAELTQLKMLCEQIILSGQELKKTLEKTGKSKKLASKANRTPEEEAILRGERELELNIRRDNRQANRELSYAEDLVPGESSYMSIHRQSTDIIIDMGSEELEKVGGYMSDRIPVRYMNEKGELEEGFFTQDYAPEWTEKEIVDRAKFVAPSLAAIIDAIVSKPDGLNSLKTKCFNFKADANGIRNTESIPLVLKEIGIDENLYMQDGKYRAFTQAEASALHDLGLRIEDLPTMMAIHITAGIEKGSNINQRNTAMSDMATLLGCGKDLAKSIPMTMMVNGEPVRGSFMKKASGIGIEEILKDLTIFDNKTLDIDYAALGESCANLLITDYICANIDRHAGNIFINIEPSKDGKRLMVKGVNGIDNDLSFGNLSINNSTAVKNLPALDDIGSIPRAMAEKVMKLDRGSLAGILVKNGINSEQIDACWSRVQSLQKKIQKNPNNFIVDTYTEKLFKAEVARQFKNHDSKFGYAPDSPFKHAQTAIDGITTKMAAFEPKFRAKANEMVNKLETEFKEEEKKLIKPDPDYDNLRQKILKAQMNKQPISEEEKKLYQEKHKPREEAKKQIEKKLGYNLKKPREALNKKAVKLAEKAFKDEYKRDQAIKRSNKGVKRLHEKLRIDSLSTVKGQIKEIESITKRLNKLGSDGTLEYQQLTDKISSLSSMLKDVAQKNRPVSDMDANIIADRFKLVQKAITAYIPAASGPNAAKLTAVAECMDNLCDIAKDSRERQVNEINELMSKAFKELAASNKQLQTIKDNPQLGVDSIEYKLADASFGAKQVLAGAVGNLGPMDNTQIGINNKAVATLTLVEHINKLKENDPQAYQSYANMLKEDPKALDQMADIIVNGKSFNDLVSKANTYMALINKPEKYIAAELDKNYKLKFFDEVASGVRNFDGSMNPEKISQQPDEETKELNKIAEKDYVPQMK